MICSCGTPGNTRRRNFNVFNPIESGRPSTNAPDKYTTTAADIIDTTAGPQPDDFQ